MWGSVPGRERNTGGAGQGKQEIRKQQICLYRDDEADVDSWEYCSPPGQVWIPFLWFAGWENVTLGRLCNLLQTVNLGAGGAGGLHHLRRGVRGGVWPPGRGLLVVLQV